MLYHRILPESVPWLAAQGRIQEAHDVIKKAAKCNHLELPEASLDGKVKRPGLGKQETDGEAEHHNETRCCHTHREAGCYHGGLSYICDCNTRPAVHNQYQYNLLHVFRSSNLRFYCIILCFVW